MSFPDNEILIGATLLICGGAGMTCMPLTNELIVETTFPAGEATSTGIGNWLAGPLSGLLVALSSLIPYGDKEEYPNSVCRDGELQNLSWFFSIINPYLQILENSSRNFSEIFIFWVVTQAVLLENSSSQFFKSFFNLFKLRQKKPLFLEEKQVNDET